MNALIDITDVILKTERLTLRPWRMEDLADFNEYASVEGVGEMAGWKHHTSMDESREILEGFCTDKKTFAIEYKGKVIGSAGINEYKEADFPELQELKCREIGYVLSRDYWGQGLMTEVVRELIRYLFEDAGLDVILCGHFLHNGRSARVQEKCGFSHYRYQKYKTLMGTVEDDKLNILTRETWESDQIVSHI